MTRQGVLTGLAVAALLAAVVTPAALLLRTVDEAAGHFDRAAVSQAQFADVLMIRAATQADDRVAIDAALVRYRADIVAETRIVGADPRGGQRAEMADAAAMTALATARPPRTAALARLVDAAAVRERTEARAMAAAMVRLRTRSRGYALLLAGIAALAAIVGAAGLLAANRRLTRAVADRTRQLVAVDASRRLFFAKVSHELRTPVTVMRGEAEVALATAADDPRALADALGEVVAHSEQLDHRIAELLALSRADDGQVSLERARVDVATLVDRAIASGGRYARANDVRLARGSIGSAEILGDPRWLEQALVAVIDNAVKFSPAGASVDVSVERQADIAEIAVADRGGGVPPDALPRLFDAYYQAEDGRARGGTGLGLALVRWVAERHGGSAHASLRDGGGSIVMLRLPVAA